MQSFACWSYSLSMARYSSSFSSSVLTVLRIKMIKGRSEISLFPRETEGHTHRFGTQWNFGEEGQKFLWLFWDKGTQFILQLSLVMWRGYLFTADGVWVGLRLRKERNMTLWMEALANSMYCSCCFYS